MKNLLKIDKKNKYKLFAGVFRQSEAIEEFAQSLKKDGREFELIVRKFPPKVADFVWNKVHFWPIEKFVGKTDIIHTSNWAQPPSEAKKVTTVHDLAPIIYPQYHQPLIANFERNLKWVRQECDGIITVSHATKIDLIKQPGWQKAELQNKVHVVHNAANKRFQLIEDKDKKRKVKQKYGIVGSYILAVGTREPRKNLTRVIKAFNKLNSEKLKLVLVGKYGWGDDVTLNNKQIAMDNVIVTGFVDDKDLPVLYSGAKMFCYPSLYEGFGLPVLEAMQCGCPVITSNVSSLPEVAGEAGIQVDPFKIDEISGAMEKLIENDAVRGRMRKEGLTQAKRFSWHQTARDTLKIYRGMMK